MLITVVFSEMEDKDNVHLKIQKENGKCVKARMTDKLFSMLMSGADEEDEDENGNGLKESEFEETEVLIGTK